MKGTMPKYPEEQIRNYPRQLWEKAGRPEGLGALRAWLDDCATEGPGLVASAGALYASWKRWAEAGNEWVGTQRSLADRLEAAGFAKVKDVAGLRGRGYRGLALKA